MKKGKLKGLLRAILHYSVFDSRYWKEWAEEARKAGLALLIAGLVGMVGGKLSVLSSSLLLIIGFTISNVALVLFCMAKHSREDKEKSK